MKYLIEFEKLEEARWLGHHDVRRVFERALRRSGLPVAYSQGFNPRQRLAFASALGVGVTASAEPAIFELHGCIAPAEVRDRLNAVLPPGLPVANAVVVGDDEARRLLNSYDRAELRITCDCAGDAGPQSLAAAVRALMAQDNVTIVRETDQRRREVNLRPFLLALDGCCTRPGEVELRVTLAFGSGGSARPREVVDALGALVPGLAIRRAHRVRLLRHELKHNGQYPSVEGGEIDFDQRNTD